MQIINIYMHLGTYCAGHSWTIARRETYQEGGTIIVDHGDGGVGRKQETTYQLAKTTEMAQSIAYARVFGGTEDEINRLIWASDQWLAYTGESCLAQGSAKLSFTTNSSGIPGRAYRYANFVYRALQSDGTLGLVANPENEDDDKLKIMVDQQADTYTLGPYILSFPNQNTAVHCGSGTLGDLVWDEIVHNYSGKFVTASIDVTITFQNGTQDQNADIEVIDADGNVIQEKFPKFGQEFYVRYKTSKDAEIVDRINPRVQIEYLKKMTRDGTNPPLCYYYEPIKFKYSMIEDPADMVKKATTNATEDSMAHNGKWGRWVYLLKGVNIHRIYLSGRNEDYMVGENGYTFETSKLYHMMETSLRYYLKKAFHDMGVGGSSIKESTVLDISWNFHIGLYIFGKGDFIENGSYTYSTSKKQKLVQNGYKEVTRNGQTYLVPVYERKTFYKATVSGAVNESTEYDYETEKDAIDAVWDKIKNNIAVMIRIEDVLNIYEEDLSQLLKVQPPVRLSTVMSKTVVEKNMIIIPSGPSGPSGPGGPGVPSGPDVPGTDPSGAKIFKMGGKEVNMYIGGNVWQDLPSIKIGDFTGKRTDSSLSMAGIQVELFDTSHNKVVARTLTDESGKYGFQKINPLLKYKVIFTYDGMRFENTKYTNDLSGGYSTASEELTSPDTRTNFNDYFDRIESSPQNYRKDGEWRKAYGLYSKLEDASEDYISYSNEGTNEGAFRYYDALEIFKKLATNSHKINSDNEDSMKNSYYKVGTGMNNGYYVTVDLGYKDIESEFKSELTGLGMSDEEAQNVWQYINDTLIQSTTVPYPEQNKFVLEDVDGRPASGTVIGYDYLYISSRDQSRNVDFGMKLRTNADLYLAKDIYKTTLLVNGKKQEYFYNKKKSETDAEGNWVINLQTGTYEYSSGTSDASQRASNEDYIGESSGGNIYTREIRKSEYLYDGSDIGSSDAKNLQAFITYKIAVKNQTQDVWTSVDEIVDYYDSSQYYSIVDLPNSTIIKENTYIGDSKGNKIYDLHVSSESIYSSKYGGMSGYYSESNNINGSHDYNSVYLTGIRSVESGNMGGSRLMPGEITYLYITFKVQNDPDTGKVKLDQKMEDLLNDNINDNTDLVGKRNIAEINGYSTYFGSSGSRKAGVIDLDSNAGSLKPRDLNADGDIISSQDPTENRLEDDEDKANNIKLKINTDEEEERSIAGYTFEDARTEISNGAVIGNGKYDENDKDFEENADKKINGITVQLVELVKEVDEQGFVTGNYEKEYIWSRVTYTKNGSTWDQHIDDTRYYSGTEGGQVILSGQGVFAVTPSTLSKDAGEYKFDSVPPGDFFVRFIYGDTTQTVLTNITDTGEGYTDKYGTKDEVQELFNKLTDEQKNSFVQGANEKIKINGASETNGTNIPEYQRILGTSGLNSRSYTGQDYKSTIYQLGVNQNSEVNNYNGIVGYTNTELQNYNRSNANDKDSMYFYNIYQSDKNTINLDGISDAKDVYSYRMDERNYSLGSTSNLEGDMQTLKNHRAEVLASGTKLVTKAEEIDKGTMLEDAVRIQRDAIKELIENTTMVSQSGIINMEVEYNRQQTDVFNAQSKQYVQNLIYKLEDLDLGLTERPEAQLLLSKELTNVQVKLANGSILFDANQSVRNLVYGKHKVYGKDEYYHNVGTDSNPGYRLRHDIQRAIKDRQEELVLATMDEEIMSGARIRLTYKLSVDNIGEVDYLDTDFYFKGKTNNTNWGNVSKTNALNVLDYVSNEMNFEVNYQNDINDWKLITTDTLLGTSQDETAEMSGSYDAETLNRIKEDNDYVNSYFKENLDTYNILIRTGRLSGDLIPRALETDLEYLSNSRREVGLTLSTLLSNTLADKNIIYTNLAEIIETSNTWGRRMELSKVGDEQAPYQSAEDKSIDESTVWVKPKGPDSDSGQKVQILAPTGENKDYQRTAIIIICVLGIIITGVIFIKNKVLKNKN